MKRDCRKFELELAALAMGEQRPDAAAHVDSCADCQRKVAELKQVIPEVRYASPVPKQLIANAKDLFPRKVFVTRPIGGFAIATRSATSERMSAEYTTADLADPIRLEYRREGDSWLVLGKGPEGDWTGTANDAPFDVSSDGRFRFVASTLDATGCLLESRDTRIEIPAWGQGGS